MLSFVPDTSTNLKNGLYENKGHISKVFKTCKNSRYEFPHIFNNSRHFVKLDFLNLWQRNGYSQNHNIQFMFLLISKTYRNVLP